MDIFDFTVVNFNIYECKKFLTCLYYFKKSHLFNQNLINIQLIRLH